MQSQDYPAQDEIIHGCHAIRWARGDRLRENVIAVGAARRSDPEWRDKIKRDQVVAQRHDHFEANGGDDPASLRHPPLKDSPRAVVVLS
jgi:hypothetical protein